MKTYLKLKPKNITHYSQRGKFKRLYNVVFPSHSISLYPNYNFYNSHNY
ncbi:MAG: hypothetical protein [Microvirus sp.]|nr:MAG: hypothetical protein [Microvirus sp.]